MAKKPTISRTPLLIGITILVIIIVFTFLPKSPKTTSTPTPSRAPELPNINIQPSIKVERSASLQINVHGAEFLLTNSKGKRVGYDFNGKVVEDISNSSYGAQFESKPGEIDSEAFIGSQANETYTLKLTKKDGRDVVININASSTSGMSSDAQVAVPHGATISGYRINFESGDKVVVTLL